MIQRVLQIHRVLRFERIYFSIILILKFVNMNGFWVTTSNWKQEASYKILLFGR